MRLCSNMFVLDLYLGVSKGQRVLKELFFHNQKEQYVAHGKVKMDMELGRLGGMGHSPVYPDAAHDSLYHEIPLLTKVKGFQCCV